MVAPAPKTLTTEHLQPEGRSPITAEEFITGGQGEGGLAEWRDGRVIIHEVPKEPHQRIAGHLFFLLLAYVARHRLGRVIIAPFKMRAAPTSPVREPDVLFLRTERLHLLTEDLLDGPADLVIEVVSDDSTARDRSDKFDEYEQGGVAEYWVIDSRPGHHRADFWVRDANGQYRAAVPSESGTYQSHVLPGFRFQVEWLWQPDPDVWDHLGSIFTPGDVAPRGQR